jgi:uncharacterized membrane protein YfcA
MIGLKNKRDVFGGATMAVFGVLAIIEGRRLGVGTLTQMEPGFVPLTLGALLLLLGFVMAFGKVAAKDESVLLAKAEWRGWFCIVAGVASFLVLGPHAGMVPAAFCCVFISALGDRTASLKGALLLAAGVTAFGAALFHYFLTVPMPLFWW